jgi:hypothetical protein
MSTRRIIWQIAFPLALLIIVACGDAEEQLPTAPTNAPPTPTDSDPSTPSTTDFPADWTLYQDEANRFALPHPPQLDRSEQTVHLTEVSGIPATDLRIISFERSDGVAVVAVSVTSNPAGVELEQWIRGQPGWPCEPGAVPTCEPVHLEISGEPAIRFSLDTLGQPTATVYVAHGTDIYVIYGNVFGVKQDGTDAALTEEEFQAILRGFRFDSN